MLVPKCDICGALCGTDVFCFKLVHAAGQRINPVTKRKDGPRDQDVCRPCYLALVEFMTQLRKAGAVRSGVEVRVEGGASEPASASAAAAVVESTPLPAPTPPPTAEPADEPVQLRADGLEVYAYGLDELGDL